jgi:hypothetical protein
VPLARKEPQDQREQPDRLDLSVSKDHQSVSEEHGKPPPIMSQAMQLAMEAEVTLRL